MEEELETLEGTFSKTIYNSSNYMVSIFNSNDGPITVTGPSFEYDKGAKYTLVGKYVDHPKYGFQFEIISISKYLPGIKDEIISYLASPLFKHIGKKAAEKIYDVFGDDTLRILQKDPESIYEVNLSELQRTGVIEGMSQINAANSDGIFDLIGVGFTSREAHLIFNRFRHATGEMLKINPFKFYLDVYGMSFNKVLECAKKVEFENSLNKYKEAYLVYLFKDLSFRTGDIYLTKEELSSKYIKQYPDFEDILNIAIEDRYLILEEDRIYLAQDYADENLIADYLNNHDKGLIIDEENMESLIKDSSNFEGIEYDPKQIEAIKNFFYNDISLIVGGPGTGKTTLIKAMVNIFKNYFVFEEIMVVAPTGRAAKRINEICGVESKTIHSLLRWNKEDNTFTFCAEQPLMYDCLIIDEFSMVDSSLFSALLKASSQVKKICIIGDDNQLPSIRQGNVLRDLIESNKFPLTRLETIHRQKEGNEIIDLAGHIVNNSVNIEDYKNDVEFIDINKFDKYDLVKRIQDLQSEGVSLDNIQILSPMYRGEFGIDALNFALQSSFNPSSKDKIEKRIGDTLYRENDKILQLKNRPDDDVYNGDIGVLQEIDLKEKNFLINYNDVYIYYKFDDLADISLAYAMSVHKAQGSEYQYVFFICAKEHYHMLYKKLIYTAISRAKTKLFVICDPNTFISTVSKEIRQRRTTLKNRICESE